MIVTARQLEDMHKSADSSGRIVLPYRARLTPLAVDFVRARKIEISYADDSSSPIAATLQVADARFVGSRPESVESGGSHLWWSDGPAGPAKAAITTEERQSGLKPIAVANDEANLINAIHLIAKEIKGGTASGAVLLVKSGARAMVFANRCPSIRAILGTCMETVEQGVDQIAANVLIIEHPHKTLSQIRNLLSRFLHRPRKLLPQTEQQLKELASCG